ncbi:MAG: hypothetical protein CMD35_01100 [Flavobacteriales bacterium]|nr:hypothetical protein [Flavobacteriales bacterium]
MFDYYAEFNGVRHLIFDRITGEAQNGVFSFTTEEVTEVTCCPMNMGIDVNSEDVIHITQNITITQNTTWDNKVYIDDDVTVWVVGATLDITSMDVIFGECAGISFVNGGTLRASNSVFRPCDLNRTWRGLRFLNNRVADVGIINECTFKNALDAVFIENVGGEETVSNVRLTNNLFSNCRAGVVLEEIAIDKSITGNTFQVDNDKPYFASNCNSESSGLSAGISMDDTEIKAEIAQNDFVNMANNWGFTGIKGTRVVGGSLSKNTFTNNERSVWIGMSTKISVEDNTVSITPSVSSDRTQFLVEYANDIRVIGNTFYNSDLNYSSLTQNSSSSSIAAIGVFNANLINIKSNEIKGFENGIFASNLGNSNIGENNIEDAWHYGVYAINPKNVDISCNTINMELIDDVTVVGIGVFYSQTITNGSNSIRGNCIFETSTAIHIEDIGVGNSTAPVIKNNYLYNYTVNGIAFQSVNATSALGSGLTQTTAGKNTFVSNNIPFGAIDVNASLSSPTTVWGCYGVSSVNGPVNLLGGDLYNSTASCGGQIGTISSGIQEDEICDRIEGNEHLYPRQTFEGRLNLEFEIELEDPTAIEVDDKVDVRSNQFEIYPNPASDEVNISLSSSESDISIINIYQINGTLIRSIELVGQNVDLKINVEDLATGAYLLKVVSDEKVIGQSKLMVTR